MSIEKIKDWEISGNLDSDKGILNYQTFQNTCAVVLNEFKTVFTQEVIQKFPLLIDNATDGSGYTPIITPILNKYLIVKLGITDGLEVGQTVFQLAHELTHLVFFSYLGLNKTHADDYEESLCSAMSIILIFKLANIEFSKYVNFLNNDEYIGYRNGVQIALDHGLSMETLKHTILEEIDRRKQQA